MTYADFKAILRLTFRNPIAAAEALLRLNLPMASRWKALAVVIILSMVLTFIAIMLVPFEIGNGCSVPAECDRGYFWLLLVLGLSAVSPLGIVLLNSVLLAKIGRMFGGSGNTPDALLLNTWIAFVLLIPDTAMSMVDISPSVGVRILFGVYAFASLILVAAFTKALHGFRTAVKPVMVTIVAQAVGLAVMLPIWGLLVKAEEILI